MRQLPYKAIQSGAADIGGTLIVTSILAGAFYLIFTLI
ncbi:hypothetical protein SAMN04515695_4252 [Pseudovibrio sp. Tun.PSC04-5.I4]|nr:hypothetical protein SAMN04515695_4252 [Pseudovibrio sp. Tun.PSC04-5.I4]